MSQLILEMQEKNKKNKINNVFFSNGLENTYKFAYDLAKNAKPGDIYCLEGELGVGKTVIAKGIGKFFNISENVTSPTFTILKTYDIDNNLIKKINHFDLYRIKNIDELLNIGFDEYIIDKNAITIIEWPEVAYELIPSTAIKIRIEKSNNKESERKITISRKTQF